jgi:arylsulfatase A-like enzyme
MGSRHGDVANGRRARPRRLVLLAGLVCGLLLAGAEARAARPAVRPNILLVLTDDMDVGLVERMPNVKELIVGQGATFTRAYVNLPLCALSRATILTGRYAQNTGVVGNNHRLFYQAGLPDRTVAVWLKAAGYRTGYIGKYLNDYPRPAPRGYVPPGWDYWLGRFAPGENAYGYEVNENGKAIRYGQDAADYVTDLYAAKALGFVEQAASDGVPFFLVLGVHAPHHPSIPAPRHAALFPDLMAPRPPSFDEADVSDKPSFIRALGPLPPKRIAAIDREYRNRARSLQAVDEAVKALVDLLEEMGQLARTYLVLASDNGLIQGLHRASGKGLPYEEVIRMPLYARGPGVAPGRVLEHLVGNADLAPTFAEWAGAPVPDEVDGHSLAPLLAAGAPGPEAWPQAYPITFTKSRSAPIAPDWRGVRTRDHLYVEHGTGERELYDMRADTYQLENLAGSADPALLARLAQLTAELGSCSGAECRVLKQPTDVTGGVSRPPSAPPDLSVRGPR